MHLPSPDGIASALSLILATVASLRAASRLEQRLCNNGSIGLMDGPPILGPTITIHNTSLTLQNVNGTSFNDDKEREGQMINVSPLWEHTEAFRYAAILGLMFDDSSLLDDDDATKSPIFSNIIRSDIREDSSNDEDSTFAASARNARGGGGVAAKIYPQITKRKEKDDQQQQSGNENPVIAISNWFVRELSAPFAAIPAWRRLLRSLHERKEEQNSHFNRWKTLIIEWPRFLLTGKSDNDRFYDSSKLDFDATISGVVRIPCVVDHPTNKKKKAQCLLSSKSVRVKSFAPNTFRDLRNKCFGVSEKEYAKSILNIVENGVMMDSEFGEQLCHSDDDDTSVADSIETIIHRRRRLFRRSSPKTLPYISFQSNSKGAARSGTFFFFTSDGAYMVKTVKKEEAKAFVEMLPKYHRFMSKSVNSRNSLLTRFCGMYSVQPVSSENDEQSSTTTVNEEKWDGGLFSSTSELSTDIADDERVYVVMNSVFPPQASSFITRRFDLKGSTVGRECSVEEIQTKGANAVLKDLNLKREVQLELTESSASDTQRKKKQPRYGIHIGSRKKAALLAQLERDVTLLQECGVLDYSLLVGVADTTTLPRRESGGGATDATLASALQHFFRWMDAPMPHYGAGVTKVDGGNLSSIRGTLMGKDVIYYMGVIDFLQPWTIKKRLERDLKGLVGYDKTAISCVAPSDYSTRFLSFINSHVT